MSADVVELPDPERWVPLGYALVRVDARGTGRSPGKMDNMSAPEADDIYDAIEWAAEQPWSTGKIGLTGLSYMAIVQWTAASRQPPHLAAFCTWEGASDWYREVSRHGEILTDFPRKLVPGPAAQGPARTRYPRVDQLVHRRAGMWSRRAQRRRPRADRWRWSPASEEEAVLQHVSFSDQSVVMNTRRVQNPAARHARELRSHRGRPGPVAQDANAPHVLR